MTRRNAYPEGLHHTDDGCEVSPTCRTCPLPACRYELHSGLRGILNLERDAEIVALRAAGWTAKSIAERFGVSKRTVFRVLQ